MKPLLFTALLICLALATNSFADDDNRQDHRKYKHERAERHKHHRYEHNHSRKQDKSHKQEKRHQANRQYRSGHNHHNQGKHYNHKPRHSNTYHWHGDKKYRNSSSHNSRHQCRHNSNSRKRDQAGSHYWGGLMLGSLGSNNNYRVYYRLDRHGNCKRIQQNHSGKVVKRVARHRCY